MGLKREEIESDPLVKQTLNACYTALSGRYSHRSEEDMRELIPPMDEIPGARVLLELDEMDSVSAAVLVATPLMSMLDIDEIETMLDPAVADAMRQFTSDLGEGAAPLLKSGNPHVLKLLVATLAGTTSSEEMQKIRQVMPAEEIRLMTVEVSDLVVEIGESLMEDKRWKTLPPKLLDSYLDSVRDLADITPGRFQKRVLAELSREIKTQVAADTADEIAGASAAPQIDPESKFEQLKNSARKFKPGGLNG